MGSCSSFNGGPSLKASNKSSRMGTTILFFSSENPQVMVGRTSNRARAEEDEEVKEYMSSECE